MRTRIAVLAALGAVLALAATPATEASVPRVILAEGFGYPS